MSYGTMHAHGVITSYLRPGATISSPTRSYRIERPINFDPASNTVTSGQALLYKAIDNLTGKPVAIKQILRPEDENVKERFRREAIFLQNHARGNRHIVQGVEAFAKRGNLFLVMEWLEGKNALQMIEAHGGPLSECEVLAIGAVLCDVITVFHRQGYLFRDMNEGNLMILNDGRVVVIDLGGILPLERSRRATGLLPPGAAPEIVKAINENREAPFSIASDVYQICSVLYFLSVANFTGENGEIAAPRTLNRQLSQAMDSLLRKGLSAHPRDRFATPGMLGNALAAVAPPSSAPPLPIRSISPIVSVPPMMPVPPVNPAFRAPVNIPNLIQRPVQVEIPPPIVAKREPTFVKRKLTQVRFMTPLQTLRTRTMPLIQRCQDFFSVMKTELRSVVQAELRSLQALFNVHNTELVVVGFFSIFAIIAILFMLIVMRLS